MKGKRDIVKILINTSLTMEEADRVIDENYGFQSIQEKVAFLKGMFDIQIIGHEKDKPNEATYFAMLNSIINS